jgi:hypothetical protein
MAITQLAEAVHNCLPTRSTQPNAVTGIRRYDEYATAEGIAVGLFQNDFSHRHKSAELLFVVQDDYRSTQVTSSAALSFLVEMMKEYFRNWVSRANPSREGGFRKPDALCMAAFGTRVHVEILEVKPIGHDEPGRKQMDEMLRIFRSGLNDALMAQTRGFGFGADDFSIRPTEWRPSPEELVCPLLNPDAADELTWACFADMLRRSAVGGILLYELHALSFRQAAESSRRIPQDMAGRIRSAYEQFVKPRLGSGPTWQESYCTARPTDASALRAIGLRFGWDGLASGFAMHLNRSPKCARAAAAAGQHRGLLQSSRPLSVIIGSETVLEPAIEEALILANAIRKH